MKPFTAIVSVFLAYTIVSSHAASLNRVRRQVVPREFANINIENYLKNDRAVAFQLKCIVYDGPCDRIGKYLKVTIPELLTNQCQNCDPAQRQRAGRLVQHIQQKYPKEWSDAVQKFQGGPVKKEDADKLESLLGVKLDSKLVAEATTAAPVPTEASSTTAAPVAAESSTTAAPTPVAASSTVAAPVVPAVEVSSTSAPVVAVSSTEAVAVAESSSTAAPAVSSSESPVVASTSAAVPLVSSSEAPVVVSSEAPVASSVAPAVSSSTAVPLVSSSEAPAAPVSTEAPVASSSPSSNVVSSSSTAPVAA